MQHFPSTKLTKALHKQLSIVLASEFPESTHHRTFCLKIQMIYFIPIIKHVSKVSVVCFKYSWLFLLALKNQYSFPPRDNEYSQKYSFSDSFDRKCSLSLQDKKEPSRSYSCGWVSATLEGMLEKYMNHQRKLLLGSDALRVFLRLTSIHFHSESNPLKVKQD